MTTENKYEKQAIMNLQRYLRQLSYTDSVIPPLPVDGIYEDATREAVTAFQRSRGLEPDGNVDRITWDSIYGEFSEAILEGAPPKKLAVFPRVPNGYTVTPGTQGFSVMAIQYMLSEISIIYDNLWNSSDDASLNGIYDENTINSVTVFQRTHSLPPTGNTDKKTWDALITVYEFVINDYI